VPYYKQSAPAKGMPDAYNTLVITRQEVQEAVQSWQQPPQKIQMDQPGWQIVKDRGGHIPVLVLHCSGYDFVSRTSTSVSQVCMTCVQLLPMFGMGRATVDIHQYDGNSRIQRTH
jgi:hypothetical protein